MMKMQGSIALCLITMTTGTNAADVTHGRVLAERWCTSCHAVGPGQGLMTEAPSFETVARKKEMDAGALALFLMNPHPKMPNMGLMRSEAADLAAYIKSLGN